MIDRFFPLSDTCKSILWLWYNDQKKWVKGGHSVIHEPTGIGVWTANHVYGLHVNYNIPNADRASGHALNGHKLEMKRRDRKALYKAIVCGLNEFAGREIQRQVSDWGSSHIRNDITSQEYVS